MNTIFYMTIKSLSILLMIKTKDKWMKFFSLINNSLMKKIKLYKNKIKKFKNYKGNWEKKIK